MKFIHSLPLACVVMIFFLLLPLYGQAPQLSEKVVRKEKNPPTKSLSNQPEISSPNPKNSSTLPIGSNISSKTEENATKKAGERKTDKPPDRLPVLRTIRNFIVVQWNNILSVLFTAAVAFFTWRLYMATKGLWKATEKQLKILEKSIAVAQETAQAAKVQAETMSDELNLKLRSKLHVRDVTIPEFENPLGRNGFPNGQLSIVNLGGMPADVIEIGAWFETGCEKGLPTEMPDESERPNVQNPQPAKVEVGQSIRYKFTDERRPWSSYEWVRTTPNENTLYVMGYVKYTDSTQLLRYSRFFREYRVLKGYEGLHKHSRRFFPIEGYEYEE